MPLTPTDPTKPQVWITGQAPNQVLDFYIPQGPKGDAGPWATTSLAAGLDLNSVVTTGLYHQGDSTQALTNLNYPLALHGGTLEVMYYGNGNAANVEQRFTPVFGGTNGLAGKVFYVRRNFNGSWSAWYRYASSRLDQAAGRVVYQWDEQNAREQIIYGDTGRRNIASSFPNPVSGAVYLSRNGMYVNLIMADYQDGSAAGTLSTATGVIPVGFRPQNWLYQPAPSARLLVIKSDGGLTMNSHSTTVWQGGYTWRTEDAWPTTLPGTAVGSIPNT